MKKILFSTLLLLTIGNNIVQARFIERFSMDGFIGFTELNASQNSLAQLDFMNFHNDYDLGQIGYISGACNMLLRNGMELNMEAGYNDIIFSQILYDFRLSAPIFKKMKLNIGFENSIQYNAYRNDHYIQQLPEFTTHNIEVYYDVHTDVERRHNQAWYGPYVGLNYSKNQNKWFLKGDINTGVFFNNAHVMTIEMKEYNSNAVKKQTYHIKTTANIWVKPEAYFAYPIIDQSRFQLGLRAKAELFLALAGINYELREYEWTWHNPVISDHKMPKHFVSDISVDFGVFFLLK